MAKLDLTKYGITGATVIAHNPSYREVVRGGDKGWSRRL